MDIVVVLGKRLNDDSSMKEELIERLDLGIETFTKVNASYIAICGGAPNRKAGVSEASQMFEYLINHNIDEERIIAEDESLTTTGNARNLKKISQYEKCGFFVGENLIITMESNEVPMDMSIIQQKIQHYLN